MRVSVDNHKNTSLKDSGAVAEGEEAIFLINRDLVRVERFFAPEKRRNKHNQRAFGEMKIRNQPVNTLEFIAGIDENSRVVGEFPCLRGTFKGTAGGCAYRDNPPAASLCLLDFLGGFIGN